MVLATIPKSKNVSVENIRLSPLDEAFVDIAEYSNGKILTEMKYLDMGRRGAIDKAYVRLSVAKRLMRAAELLPSGYCLKIYDTWRPFSVQKDIYDEYYSYLLHKEENVDLSEAELHALTRKFVSYPSTEKEISYVHSSGGAVDLTIAHKDGKELNMGCDFDEFTTGAATDAYENTDGEIRDNRRLLYTVMTEAGFTNYNEEWWHYDYGDAFWAARTGNDAMYRSVFTEEEVKNDR